MKNISKLLNAVSESPNKLQHFTSDINNLCRFTSPEYGLEGAGNIKIFKNNGQRSLTKSREYALNEYQNGATIYVINSKILSDELDIDLSEEKFTDLSFSLFYSKRGSSMPLHWDSLNNLTIQLAGEKKWVVSNNLFAENPLKNFSLLDGKLNGKIINRDDKNSFQFESFTLNDESSVYVPNGYWHETYTVSDSASISINWKYISLFSLLEKRIRGELIHFSEFRKPLFLLSDKELNDAINMIDVIYKEYRK